ncbi:hypothetical protein LINPERHAP2_LOCUS869 [Linum perenne]
MQLKQWSSRSVTATGSCNYDSKLHYLGGQIRVLTVNLSISFSGCRVSEELHKHPLIQSIMPDRELVYITLVINQESVIEDLTQEFCLPINHRPVENVYTLSVVPCLLISV